MCDSKWIFTEDQLVNARKSEINGCKISEEMELFWRQEGAQLIQNMGERLKVSQLCINSAIVFFQRFYIFHPFSIFPHLDIAATAFFLSSKVEEHPRKLIDVIRVLSILGQKMTDKEMKDKMEELILYENFMVQTLGNDFSVIHPHAHIIQAVQNLRLLPGFADMGKIFYFMATCTLHLTKMCLKYPSSHVAASCIDITCRWQSFELPEEVDGQPWFKKIDENLSMEVLLNLRREFFQTLEKSPQKIQNKIETIMANRKTEVPRPPISHRASIVSSKALHEKQTNHQKLNFTSHNNKHSSSFKSQLGKRPSQDHSGTENRHCKKSSSSGNIQTQSSHRQISFNQLPKAESDDGSQRVWRNSAEDCTSNKRKFGSLSDGDYSEESDRECKMRKVEDFTDHSKMTDDPSYKDFSPPKTDAAATSSESLMNVVNLKLTFMPSEQIYIPPASNGFPDFYDFKQDFVGSNGENVNAGC